GKQLWAERYEQELEDIFAVQDEITKQIITELQVKLTEGEQARVFAKGTDNLEAYLKFLQARELLMNFKPENQPMIRQLLQEAIELDPDYPLAYWALGGSYTMDYFYGLTKSPKKSIEQAYELLQKSSALDEKLGVTQFGLSIIFTLKGQHEKAIEHGLLAVELDPNSSDFKQNLARILMNAGRPQKSIPLYKKALRLNPYSPSGHYSNYGYALWMMGQYEEALAAGEEARRRGPNDMFSHILLTAAYTELGRDQDARDSASEILKIKPDITLEWLAKMLPWKNKDDVNRLIGDLSKAGLPEHPPLKLPDKPSIAVLPFTNMSGDPEQEYFADGMTDDLITALSKISGIFVISRNSVFTFKDKPTIIQQVAMELNVHYVLEGSVRRAGDTIRVNAQLIDANTDHHLWAEKYDGRIEDVFSLQDNITQRIVSALSVKLTNQEQALISSTDTDNIEAYDLFLKARSLRNQFTPESFVEASRLLKKATELDPNYSQAYAELAYIYWDAQAQGAPFLKALGIGQSVAIGFLDDGSLGSGRSLAIGFLELAMQNPTHLAHQIAAGVAISRRQFKIAAEHARKAIEMSPNYPEGYAALSQIFKDTQPEQALSYAKMEAKLDPNRLPFSLYKQAEAYFFMKNYEKTVELMERACVHAPRLLENNGILVAALAHLGRKEEAKDIYLNNFLKVQASQFPPPPELIIRDWGIQNPEMADLLINGLMKVGLPAVPDSYCRLSESERLSIEEVKEIVIDKTWKGNFWFISSFGFWDYFLKNGENTLKTLFSTENREYGFDENGLYVLKNVKGMKVKSYRTIYRNPHGHYDQRNEYISVDEVMVASFSVLKDSE
ncbi:MAG: tetratricopeptide repeat protein, partial [Alphaproteobacteria bacterium]|nr:tetratricopeptide repeat protein [Alphaproteobacteria bacterium]